jgi:hypothetical protein
MTPAIRRAVQEVLDPSRPRSPRTLGAPAAEEHDPYYAAYISRVPEGDLVAILQRQAEEVADWFGALTEAQAEFAYAADKWTVLEVLGHLTDAERVFAYRATSIARGDAAALPGFSQDDWMRERPFAGRSMASLLTEWLAVRAATVAFVEALPAGAESRRGTASGRPFSVRALLHVPPGHTDYHLAHLRECYAGDAQWPR